MFQQRGKFKVECVASLRFIYTSDFELRFSLYVLTLATENAGVKNQMLLTQIINLLKAMRKRKQKR